MKLFQNDWRTLSLLATTQVISWGSLYYAITILAPEIQAEMNWRAEIIFGAFSLCLLVGGIVSTPVGVFLDRYGGRLAMGIGSLLSAIGLIGLSEVHTIIQYYIAWSILGLGMALALYEAAFATINIHLGSRSRQGISILTLVGGFASTIFWPLTLHLNTMYGWRKVYLIFGLIHLLICLPLHLLLEKHKYNKDEIFILESESNYSLLNAVKHPSFWKLAFAFSANSLVFSALSAHLIPLVKNLGHSASYAVFAASLIGPMQVLGRLGEMSIGRNILPQTIGKFTFLILPFALFILFFLGSTYPAVIIFCLLYGLSNGILTILRGTIPRSLFGPKNYGAISGALAGPALLSKAAGPLIIAAFIQSETASPWIIGTLLIFSIMSLLFYFAANNNRSSF